MRGLPLMPFPSFVPPTVASSPGPFVLGATPSETGERLVQVSRALDAQKEVLQAKPLVGRMRVLVRLAKAHEQAWFAGAFRDGAHEGNGPAFANEDGGAAERLAEGLLSQGHGPIVRLRCEGVAAGNI